MGEFEGKVAVITGGTSGIGLGIALALLEEGTKVIATGRNEERIQAARQRLSTIPGAQFDVVQLDAAKEEDHQKLARLAIEKYGKLDMAFNNAGANFHRVWANITDLDWEYIFQANFYSTVYGMRTYLPIFDAQESGGIMCNTASIGGLISSPTMAAYCASKAAVIMMTEVAYTDRAMTGANPYTHLCVVCPSSVVSNLERNCESSRPEKYREAEDHSTDIDRQINEFLKGMTAEGADKQLEQTLSYEEAGKIILQGIKDKKLYILTHPEQTQEYVKNRVKTILGGYFVPSN